ncbi:hypothetical protein ES703_15493 [subsurface metagenome]
MKITDTKKTPEVARELGLGDSTIHRWCQTLDYKKNGRDYFLTREQVEQIKKVANCKVGRPCKTLVKLSEEHLRHVVHAVLQAKEQKNEIAVVGGAGWGNTFAVKIDPDMSEEMFSKKLEALAEK